MREVRCLLVCLCIVWACAIQSPGVAAAVHTTSRPNAPHGIFSLTPTEQPIHDSILKNPAVTGVSLRARWQSIERSEGHYDWSYLDRELARAASAGKVVLLRIIAGGRNTPAWVLDAGVQTFTFQDGNLYRRSAHRSITIPVFWDAVFLQKKARLIAAAGRHFAEQRHIVLVSAACANAMTDDWNIQHRPPYVAQWRQLGYTSEKLFTACRTIIDQTMRAFTTPSVLMAFKHNGAQLDPYSDYVPRQVIAYARATYPGRFVAQKNALAVTTPDPQKTSELEDWALLFEQRPDTGGQMLWYVSDDASCRMQGAVTPCEPARVLQQAVAIGARYGMRYLEIYEQDMRNPRLAEVIQEAAALFRPR